MPLGSFHDNLNTPRGFRFHLLLPSSAFGCSTDCNHFRTGMTEVADSQHARRSWQRSSLLVRNGLFLLSASWPQAGGSKERPWPTCRDISWTTSTRTLCTVSATSCGQKGSVSINGKYYGRHIKAYPKFPSLISFTKR